MKRSFKRAIHFDFHTLAGIDGLLQNFDATDFAKTLADANVGYINFTAMCNNGYCYYPTRVGTVYPGLKRDILGEVLGAERYAFFNGIAPEFMTNAHAEIEALPSWIWIHYDSFPQRAAYLRGLYDTRIYMTGLFQRDWGDFGGYRPRAAMENDLYDALMNGYELSFGDHLHPVSGINKALYKIIGDVFDQAKAYDPYTDGARYAADIAVLCENYEDLMDTRNRGASRMLSELKYTYDFVNPDMDFDPYRLIIVPDRIPMTESLQLKLDQYITRGGKLITSGTAGLKPDRSGFALEDYRTITVDGVDPVKTAYFQFKNELEDYPQTVWSIYYYKHQDGSIGGQQILMKNNGGDFLAITTLCSLPQIWTPSCPNREYGTVTETAFDVFFH